jgi:hypothetical protein
MNVVQSEKAFDAIRQFADRAPLRARHLNFRKGARHACTPVYLAGLRIAKEFDAHGKNHLIRQSEALEAVVKYDFSARIPHPKPEFDPLFSLQHRSAPSNAK